MAEIRVFPLLQLLPYIEGELLSAHLPRALPQCKLCKACYTWLIAAIKENSCKAGCHFATFFQLKRGHLQVQYDGRDLWQCGTNYVRHHDDLPPGTCTIVPSGNPVKTALRLNRNPNEAPWEAAALIGFLIIMRLLVYCALRYKTKSRVR